ncbi:PAS domain-containing sensor histidine kinase [Desulfoluna spongiiphila]|uniref:PAS domain-containing sensor histidine kinase n=1 Tax=Desulfoluna spongiiphila TaxID=419481 RepID=UPI0012561D95|nr:ATP-binding protein [Desulfoluna spongiiphila]VVS91091.1 pas fold-4 [Desulfoluna spongiiphila]
MTQCVKNTEKGLIKSVCPYTGLTTYTRPEWTNAIFGNDYSVSITIIGDRIFAAKIKGFSTREVVAEATSFSLSVVRKVFKEDQNFIYIGDFTGIVGLTKDARRYYVNYLKNIKQISTFILCSPSPFMMLAGNLSKRFNITKFNVLVKNDYPAAVKHAVLLTKSGLLSQASNERMQNSQTFFKSTPPFTEGLHIKDKVQHALPLLWRSKRHPVSLPRYTRGEWEYRTTDYSARYELINDNIIHKISKGYLCAECVKPVYDIQERMLKSCGLSGHPYYIVNDVEELRGSSLKARKKHARLFAEWLEKYPDICQVVVYGANRLLRAGLSIATYNTPFSFVFADNSEEAMAIVQKNKEKLPFVRSGFFLKRKNRKNSVKHYANELNGFLGNINWEVEGSEELIETKSDEHPFKTVYDAIALIKSDIDELFRDRMMAQVALRESEEVASALLNATSDLALLIQSDGTIISVNHAFAAFLRQNQESLKGARLTDFFPPSIVESTTTHLKGVLMVGEPALFETQLNGLYYQNTIYPVFNADKKVDRLALYSRDITGIKLAQEQIHLLTQELIKAQENERRRIARDLHDNVAQDLASLIIRSDTLFEDHRDIPWEVRQRSKKFSDILKKTIASIRDLVYDLRPPGLTDIGLVKTIDQYCIEFTGKTEIKVDLYTAGLERIQLDTDTKINLFRIIQEALNNAAKHAEATLIKVRLLCSHPDLILRIEDNGCGFEPEERMVSALKEKRMGLKSMEERVNLLSGSLTLHSREGAGTRIVVKFPSNRAIQEEEMEMERTLKKLL